MSNAKQATPHSALIAELMDSRVPKTEREHAAIREIETLRERLAQKGEPSAEPIQPNEVLFAVEIPEGYGDVHPELLGEDAFSGKGWVRWRVVPTDEPSAEPVYCSCGDQIVQDDDPKCGTCVSLLQKDESSEEPVDLQDIEQYRMQMAGICTAALGYWKDGDSVHPDYDTPALREVAELYAKYAKLAAQPTRASLTDYVNAADISANDMPNVVVEKLQRAIERAHGVGEKK